MAIDPKVPETVRPEAPEADEQPQAPQAALSPEPEAATDAAPAPEDHEPEDHEPEDHEPEDHEPEDHEPEVELDLAELEAKAGKADAYLELARRTQADFENYRKRAARESAAAQERGVVKLAMELLPAVDNLDRALQAAEAAGNGDEGDDTLVSGIKLVHADVIAALARVGIERFSPEGEQFDPQHHEAVAQQPVEGAQLGTITEVYQRGYRLGDSVLRPARVVVAG